MFASNNLSAADVAAVIGGNRNNGFGDGDGWWIILLAYRMEDKDNTIAELRSQVNALNLSASQSNQNAYLVAQLKTPAPVPAYTVPNPNGYYGCQQNCYQSCGC